MMPRLRKIIVALLIVIIVGRIAYVNIAYPSATFKMLKVSETFKGEIFDTSVDGIHSYSKDEWMDYLKKNKIAPEEEAYRIAYIGAPDAFTEGRDYYVQYDYTKDYTVIMIETKVTNKSDETQDFKVYNSFNLMNATCSETEKQSDYYSSVLSGVEFNKSGLSVRIKADETKPMNIVYICDSNSDSYVLEKLELGNNQRLKISTFK